MGLGHKIIWFFHRKKIVYSTLIEPAQYFKAIEVKGKKYIRVVQTNIVNRNNSHPIYDIPVAFVRGVRICHSPFQLFLMKLFFKKPSTKIKIRKITK